MIKPKFYSSHRVRSSIQSSPEIYKDDNDYLQCIEDNSRNILEIGFGTGSSVKQMYESNKDNYYCIESYALGIRNLSKYISKHEIKNIFLFQGDAIDIIESKIPDYSMNEILIFFPDPWPKSRHHKRRLLNNYSIDLIFKKIKKDGVFHFASDHINYSYQTKKLLSDHLGEIINFSSNRRHRPVTNYEERGLSKGNFIFDIIVKKKD